MYGLRAGYADCSPSEDRRSTGGCDRPLPVRRPDQVPYCDGEISLCILLRVGRSDRRDEYGRCRLVPDEEPLREEEEEEEEDEEDVTEGDE